MADNAVADLQARPGDAGIWDAVNELIDRSPELHDLRTHGLHLLAARRWREVGIPLPADLVSEERVAAVLSLMTRPLLERVVPALAGPVLVLKGPEVAQRYPSPHLRWYGDIDLLVPDAKGAYEALIAAGFDPVGDPRLYSGIHHERPLKAPDLPLSVELHSRPKWVDWSPPPSIGELLDAAVPSALGIEGASTLHPAHHALALAVHSWAHVPLRRLADMVDVALFASETDMGLVRGLAADWGLARLWRTTERTMDTVLAGDHPGWPVRVWARNLRQVRERTVLENHLAAWLSGFSALPPRRAFAAMVRGLANDLRPAADEGWREKTRRSRRALARGSARLSEHHEDLGTEAFKLRRKAAS